MGRLTIHSMHCWQRSCTAKNLISCLIVKVWHDD
uniref:Uncharacterized protein n=1 Tax=Arundo donax TaxID=35708 RepID=A0A0A9H3Z7_ARUDO